MTYQQELNTAFERAKSFNLIEQAPVLQQTGILADEDLRKELGAVCQSYLPGSPVGMCLLVAQSCIQYVTERLDRQAWIVVGYLEDTALNKKFWISDPDEVCRVMRDGKMGIMEVMEFHAWVMLDTGEIIDPVVFPTLAEMFPKKFPRGKGRTNFVMNTGRPYKVVPGLPLLQYHPQGILSVD